MTTKRKIPARVMLCRDKLRALLRYHDMSQIQFAEKAGVSKNYVSQVLSDDPVRIRKMNLEIFIGIALAFPNLDLRDFLLREESVDDFFERLVTARSHTNKVAEPALFEPVREPEKPKNEIAESSSSRIDDESHLLMAQMLRQIARIENLESRVSRLERR
jgi:transcriptional regulator with XRE-family HTH domain